MSQDLSNALNDLTDELKRHRKTRRRHARNQRITGGVPSYSLALWHLMVLDHKCGFFQ